MKTRRRGQRQRRQRRQRRRRRRRRRRGCRLLTIDLLLKQLLVHSRASRAQWQLEQDDEQDQQDDVEHDRGNADVGSGQERAIGRAVGPTAATHQLSVSRGRAALVGADVRSTPLMSPQKWFRDYMQLPNPGTRWISLWLRKLHTKSNLYARFQL